MKQAICPFCDQKQSYRFIIESEHVRAIYPKAPACRFHVLLVPKRHVAHFDELTNEEVAEMQQLNRKLVAAVKRNEPDFIGYNLLSNNGGPAVRQRVMHTHMHVFLRTSVDPDDVLLGSHTATPPELTDDEKKNIQVLKEWLN